MENVDFTPIVQTVIAIAAAVLTYAGTWALARLGKLLGLKANDELAVSLDAALHHAIDYAVEKAKQAGKDLSSVPVRNQIAHDAAMYIIPKIPDLMEKLKLDATGITERIIARFEPSPTLPSLPPAPPPVGATP